MTALPNQTGGAASPREPLKGEPPEGQAQAAPAAVPRQQKKSASRWTDSAFWQRWAMRLLTLWAVLSLGMVGLRVATAHIRPELRQETAAGEELVKQRDALSLEVQGLHSAGRIQEWAEAAGMVRFASAAKESAEISGIQAPPVPQDPAPAVKVGVQWQGTPKAP